jgi:hypothetical protein
VTRTAFGARVGVLGVLLLGELVATLYVAAVALLMSTWFLNDSLAVSLSSAGWWRIGLVRFGGSAVVGVLGGLLIYAINRGALSLLRLPFPHLAQRSAVVSGGIVVVAALVGSIYFIVARPHF